MCRPPGAIRYPIANLLPPGRTIESLGVEPLDAVDPGGPSYRVIRFSSSR
jgi:hypothetical protein